MHVCVWCICVCDACVCAMHMCVRCMCVCDAYVWDTCVIGCHEERKIILFIGNPKGRSMMISNVCQWWSPMCVIINVCHHQCVSSSMCVIINVCHRVPYDALWHKHPSPEHDFTYLYWTISKILSANLFTCKERYLTDWVGRYDALSHKYPCIYHTNIHGSFRSAL